MSYVDRADNFVSSLGFEAYRVGGSVRDELLDRRVKDCDYVIFGADLDSIARSLMFSGSTGRVTPLKPRGGVQIGWRVVAPGLGCLEIALPRTEISNGPGHRDFEIVVDPGLTLEEDARRRDFTFNALYKPARGGEVVDPTGRGLFDLERRIVNVTHDDSFRDDPLRMLRALRFVALGYDLSDHSYVLMIDHAASITALTDKGISGTALSELEKILMGENAPTALKYGTQSDVLPCLVPEAAWTTDISRAVHVDAPVEVRWAMLFQGNLEGWFDASLALNTPKKLRSTVAALVQEAPFVSKWDPSLVGRQRVRLGDELLKKLLMLYACTAEQEGVWHAGRLELARGAMKNAGVPASIGELHVDGRDAMGLGLEGPEIGAALTELLNEVVTGPVECLEPRWQSRRLEELA